MKKIKSEGVEKTIGHINSIDGIRGIAVLFVVFFHYLRLRLSVSDDIFISFVSANYWPSFFVNHGYMGVDIFFILTGFLLVTPWLAHRYKDKPKPSLKKYFSRRVFRIIPAYYVHLFVLFLLAVPFFYGKTSLFNIYGFQNVLHHFLFTHYFSPLTSSSFNINGALWTLSLEAQFYVVLPFIAYGLVRKFWTTVGSLILLSTIWRYISYTQETFISDFYMGIGARWEIPLETIQNFIGTQLIGYLGHFMLGIILAYLFIRRVKIPKMIAVFLAVTSGVILYFSLVKSLDLHLFAIVPPLLLSSIFYYLFTYPKTLFSKLISNKIFSYIGMISYSMYLYHLPLLLFLNKILIPSDNVIFIVIYGLLLVIISHLSYTYIEKYFMQKKIKVS